jgi:transcriptional regulator with XRE-family HTH domain
MTLERAAIDHDIGGRLRRAREQRGLSLRDAARETKLSVAVLQAIERNDFARLPGGMFRKAYVRTLAGVAGLDPDEMAAEYCEQFEPRPDPSAAPAQDAALHQALLRQVRPSRRRSIVTLAALAVLAIGWFRLQPEPVTPPPLLDAATELVAVPMPPTVAMTLAADSSPDPTPRAIAARATDVPLRIELVATGWCWVAAEADGARVIYRLVEPGERVVVEGESLISLRLGDAGSVTLSINDGASRSVGGAGEVVELEVTPDNVDGLRAAAVETEV